MKRSPRARAILPALLALGLAAVTARAEGPTGLQHDVVFSDYSQLASMSEVLRRTLSPLDELQLQEQLTRSGRHLEGQSINLANERFVLYVPAQAPIFGYGLMVFVPPWEDARMPADWAQVMDRYGMIFVSAARSGNEQNVATRREPLAITAAYNVMQRYPVAAQRVFVAGFSGGSRVAQRLALAYPDLFRGALLNAGSDPISGRGAMLPPADVFSQAQTDLHVLYLTGDRDSSLPGDASSIESLHRWCVFGTDSHVILGRSHESAPAAALDGALKTLLAAPNDPPDPARLATCRATITAPMNAQLGKVQSLLSEGDRRGAQKLLTEVDHSFGGLAAPRSVELQKAIDTP
jgi:poly(3-hydroxybutyrate) depolymerase